MSVYTPVSEAELKAFLEHYDLGQLESFEGISAGIENTNYFVTTSGARMVLTLFENHSADELPYFLDLTAHLAEHGVPCAHPLAARDGRYLLELNGKPAALVQRLSGSGVEESSVAQCAAIGETLARLHIAGQSYPGRRDNDRGPHWWHETAELLLPKLNEADAALLRAEMAEQAEHRRDALPRGVIHADLFRDNALFDGDRLCGLIDFYYACNDALLYDLAVTVNDWCADGQGGLDAERTTALLRAYKAVRPVEAQETQDWPLMLRAGALRFWLSRLKDLHFPREGELTHTKDPEVFKRILQRRIADEASLRALWEGA